MNNLIAINGVTQSINSIRKRVSLQFSFYSNASFFESHEHEFSYS